MNEEYISEGPREKTSIELPVALNRALYRTMQALRREMGETTSRPEIIGALMFHAVNLETAKVDEILRKYRQATPSDIPNGLVELDDGRRRGRPKWSKAVSE